MTNDDSRPVSVTGEERAHPAIRQLARACIALARLQLEQENAAAQANDEAPAKPAGALEEDGHDG